MFKMFKKPAPQDLAVQAHPLHINPLPHSNEALLRHMKRVARLIVAHEKAEKVGDVYRMAALAKEMDRRRLVCQAMEVKLPATVEELEELAHHYGG